MIVRVGGGWKPQGIDGIFGASSTMSRIVKNYSSPASDSAKMFSATLGDVDPFGSVRAMGLEHLHLSSTAGIFNSVLGDAAKSQAAVREWRHAVGGTGVEDVLKSEVAVAAIDRAVGGTGVDASSFVSALTETLRSAGMASWQTTLTGAPVERLEQVLERVDRPEISRAVAGGFLPALPELDLVSAIYAIALLIELAVVAALTEEGMPVAALSALVGTLITLAQALDRERGKD